ncbi:MAG: alpha/beta fold hydrolase, partial [Chloroflexi bacterium]|nr:alpha/beta fold hydrolase [Chloroflexota bacterium]
MRRHHLAGLAVVLPLVLSACSGAAPSSGAGASAATGAATAAPPSSGAASAAATISPELVADIDVGGRTLHLVCVGPEVAGTPAVVLEAGLGGPYGAWSEILTSMRSSRRVCAYDRAGLGASPPAPEASRTTEDAVADLHALLTTADVAGPYVMVGHSIGAWTIALYTSEYPDDVAGLVFVDPRGPKVSAGWAAALPAPAASEDPAVAANREELGVFETDPSMNDEHLQIAESAAQANAVLDADGPLFGDRPVVVLGAADTQTNWAD